MIARPLLVLATATILTASSLHAQVFTEVGDAGQTLGTASATGIGGTSLTTIAGTISNSLDADLFLIRITNTMLFSASTVGSSLLDTALFLFDSAGNPIFTNDDASGTSLQSTLPAGTSFMMTLTPGLYYLGISLSGNEPINLNAQLLFAGVPNGDTTAVRGRANNLNPSSLFNFNGNTFFAESGAYQITLTATQSAVPEPSTVALATAGAAGMAWWLRRRAQKRSA